MKVLLAELPGVLCLVKLAEHALDNDVRVFLLALELVCK